MNFILALLSVPLVLLGVFLAPMFGFHFCPQEAAMVGASLAVIPVVGPYLKAKLISISAKGHCCKGH